jgi:signal recognition particle receptor subunit beta
MHPNDAEFPLPSSNTTNTTTNSPLIRVIDIPGHPRIRGRYFDQHISPAAGIVFVIDSVDFMPRKTEAAEQLYEILTHPVVSKKRLPILLACNKADAGPKAHTVDFIRKRLERELDAVRETRGALDDLDSTTHKGNSGGGVYLGPMGEAFTFEALATKAKGPLVTATAVSAVDAGGWSDVVLFIKKCIR